MGCDSGEIAWAAGFLEGEGNISCSNNCIRVRAAQVDRVPLGRLHELFGGTLNGPYESQTPHGKPVWQWAIFSRDAQKCLENIIPFLSGKKAMTAHLVLAEQSKIIEERNARKLVCKHGHPRTPENTYTAPTGNESCRICRNIASYESKKRRNDIPIVFEPADFDKIMWREKYGLRLK